MPTAFFGRMLDADAHLYLEPETMAEILAPIGTDWVVDMVASVKASPSFESDRERANGDVWNVKGLAAFGACEPEVRILAMDAMGVARQLAFPNILGRETRAPSPEAWSVVRRYNDYCLEWTRRSGGRSVGVCELNMTDRDLAIAEVRRVVGRGAKAVGLSMAAPPAGTSPANPVWDELWDVLSAAGVPAFLHIGACGPFSSVPGDPLLVAREWWDSPTLRTPFPDQPGSEERIGPVWAVLAPTLLEIVLVPMIMGGIFERFPRLTLGVIEFGAQWLGPLVERMDIHASLMAKVSTALPMAPSDYVRRNVRCTPYFAEPVDRFIDRYGLEEVYCFSTDYPHVEGGRDPIGRFRATLEPLGNEVLERFFTTNAAPLFAA